MGPSPQKGTRSDLCLRPAGGAATAALNRYGMNLRVVGAEAARPAAIKLIVSIATKGFGGLLVEMLLAAHHFRVEETALKVLNDQFFRPRPGVRRRRFVASDAVLRGGGGPLRWRPRNASWSSSGSIPDGPGHGRAA